MTLEDFFTLTEMKGGLATLARVEELVSVMQKQKDCVLSNVGDAARQWSTVARTLAATENKDCLKHFIQLNGLYFHSQWLQEAQKYNNDVGDSVVEELINALLESLEILPVDMENSTAFGIGIAVEQLLGHKSLKIQERAKFLYDKWNQVKDNGCQDLEKGGACQDDQPKPSADASSTEGSLSKHSTPDISSCRGTDEGHCGVESVGTESHHSNISRCSDSSQLDTTRDVKIYLPNQILHTTPSNSADANAVGEVNSLESSLVSNPCLENLSVTEESSVSPAKGLVSTGRGSSPTRRGRDVDDQHDVSMLKVVLDGAKEMEVEVNTKEGSPCTSSHKELCNVSSSSGLSASGRVQKPVMEPSSSGDLDSKESESCISKTAEHQSKSGGVDCAKPKYLRTEKDLKQVGHVTKDFQDSSTNGCNLRKIDTPEISCHQIEAVGSVSGVKELNIMANVKVCKDVVFPSGSSKTMDKGTVEMDQRTELGLECGEIDALEVARQVAIEVEREVVDYREPFCSSSPEGNSGDNMDTNSPPDCVEGNKQDQLVIEELNGNGSPTAKKEFSDGASSPKEDSSRISEDIGINHTEHEQDLESPKSTSVAQDSIGKIDRNRCDFDLNEDVCPEEFDCVMNSIPSNSVNLSAPIAVVPSSKGAPGLPVTPLHFEGELGWRGSAATSAFRPASPRRTPDGEKSYSDPKQKKNFLEIDLNVTESEDDVAVNPMSAKQVPVSTFLPSGDSSVEVSSKRAERLTLDLNRLGDEEMSLHPLSYWRLQHQNGDQSPSVSSSSSRESRPPSMRDFDLNDNPSFFDAGSSHKLNKSTLKAPDTYGSFKLDDPVITIMGSRMSVERKDNANQLGHHQSFLGNGPSMEPIMDARPALPYAHMLPPAYGYNGLAMGSIMSIPPAFYGPGSMPYMVDSRGATVIPQVLGSAGLNGAPSAMPPFLMSVTNAPSGFNGFGSSRPILDLNSGMASVENGSKEVGSFKQMFMQGHNGFTEEQTKSASQPSSSGVAQKRKEPDCGRETYAMGYKQMTSWQ